MGNKKKKNSEGVSRKIPTYRSLVWDNIVYEKMVQYHGNISTVGHIKTSIEKLKKTYSSKIFFFGLQDVRRSS